MKPLRPISNSQLTQAPAVDGMAPLLTIGYSCLAERLNNIVRPEAHEGVDFVVCIQGEEPDTLPEWARIVMVDGRGVAKSRNAAIDAAAGRFLLFCDDDVSINLPGIMAGVQHLERSGQAVVLGQGVNPSGQLRKTYPEGVTRLTRFNTAKTATYEMLIDVAQVRSAGIRFDERFGAGTQLHLADEYIFVVDLLRAGLDGQAIPEVFGMHPEISSGDRWDSGRDAHVRAVALNHVFGRAAPFARTAFAVKHRGELGDLRSIFEFITDSARPPVAGTGCGPAEG